MKTDYFKITLAHTLQLEHVESFFFLKAICTKLINLVSLEQSPRNCFTCGQGKVNERQQVDHHNCLLA